MPRPRPPPTPLSSTDITGKDTLHNPDTITGFTLPPPAIQSATAKSPSKSSEISLAINMQRSPPQSPEDCTTGSSRRRKRTLSGSAKVAMEQHAMPSAVQPSSDILPPPPTRARKIIQMKPKQPSITKNEEQVTIQRSPTSSNQSSTTSTSSTSRRSKQPSTTSAAGRKIARKTAHSIIERRRRSKMNEEFGVLKDMVPACTGIQMHKLAILQAGIEYLRYLEGCIETLKAQGPDRRMRDEEEGVGDDESMEIDSVPRVRATREPSLSVLSEDSSIAGDHAARTYTQSETVSQNHRASSVITCSTDSTYPSPDLRPTNSLSSTSTSSYHRNRLPLPVNYTQQRHQQHQPLIPSSGYSVSPPYVTDPTPLQTGVSPAFNGFHISPDLTRTPTWGAAYGNNTAVGKLSPHILPLPQAALPLAQCMPHAGEGHAEATATAALMMLTNDRRASVSMTRSGSGKGLSVKDLLSS